MVDYGRIAAVFGRFLLMIRPFTAVSSRRNARPGKSVCVYLPSSINLQYVSLNIQYYIFISVIMCSHRSTAIIFVILLFLFGLCNGELKDN
ncbi:unnamed protein product [Rotaria socialis]